MCSRQNIVYHAGPINGPRGRKQPGIEEHARFPLERMDPDLRLENMF